MTAVTTQPLTLEEFLKLPETNQQPVLLQGDDSLPVLPEIELAPTVNQVFVWLKMGG